MYYQRLIEKEIEKKLKSSGAIVVTGPKFCGKTTTCMLHQKSGSLKGFIHHRGLRRMES